MALHNGVTMNKEQEKEKEKESLNIFGKHQKKEISSLLANVVNLLEPEPYDVLGDLFMDLELSNTHIR